MCFCVEAIEQQRLMGGLHCGRPETPVTLNFKEMEGSLYNTPPCWSIYVCGLVFKHLLAAGGLPAVKANNDAKAKLVRHRQTATPAQPGGAVWEKTWRFGKSLGMLCPEGQDHRGDR